MHSLDSSSTKFVHSITTRVAIMKTKIYMKQRTKKKNYKNFFKKKFVAHQTISRTKIQILVTPNQFDNEQRKVTIKEIFIKEQKTTNAILSTIKSWKVCEIIWVKGNECLLLLIYFILSCKKKKLLYQDSSNKKEGKWVRIWLSFWNIVETCG